MLDNSDASTTFEEYFSFNSGSLKPISKSNYLENVETTTSNLNCNKEQETNDEANRTRLPELKCSKYTWIGHPSMEKRRKARRERQARDRVWIQPEPIKDKPQPEKRAKHEPLGYEYSKHSKSLFNIIDSGDDRIHLPQLSPRATQLVVSDPQLLREKSIVFGDYTKTGQLQRFTMDKAVVPTVYGDMFVSEDNRKRYIKSMFIKDKKRDAYSEERKNPDCKKYKLVSVDKCQFCDVMGNKYCEACIEQRNKHFAQRYEKKITAKSS